VTSVILGPRTLEQLEDSLQALAVTITNEDAAAVDRLVPPGTSALQESRPQASAGR
jgi:aryl-alcohol dehydrogenase-like predicted oxidoreductase